MRYRKATLMGMAAVTLLVVVGIYTLGWLHGRDSAACVSATCS